MMGYYMIVWTCIIKHKQKQHTTNHTRQRRTTGMPEGSNTQKSNIKTNTCQLLLQIILHNKYSDKIPTGATNKCKQQNNQINNTEEPNKRHARGDTSSEENWRHIKGKQNQNNKIKTPGSMSDNEENKRKNHSPPAENTQQRSNITSTAEQIYKPKSRIIKTTTEEKRQNKKQQKHQGQNQNTKIQNNQPEQNSSQSTTTQNKIAAGALELYEERMKLPTPSPPTIEVDNMTLEETTAAKQNKINKEYIEDKDSSSDQQSVEQAGSTESESDSDIANKTPKDTRIIHEEPDPSVQGMSDDQDNNHNTSIDNKIDNILTEQRFPLPMEQPEPQEMTTKDNKRRILKHGFFHQTDRTTTAMGAPHDRPEELISVNPQHTEQERTKWEITPADCYPRCYDEQYIPNQTEQYHTNFESINYTHRPADMIQGSTETINKIRDAESKANAEQDRINYIDNQTQRMSETTSANILHIPYSKVTYNHDHNNLASVHLTLLHQNRYLQGENNDDATEQAKNPYDYTNIMNQEYQWLAMQQTTAIPEVEPHRRMDENTNKADPAWYGPYTQEQHRAWYTTVQPATLTMFTIAKTKEIEQRYKTMEDESDRHLINQHKYETETLYRNIDIARRLLTGTSQTKGIMDINGANYKWMQYTGTPNCTPKTITVAVSHNTIEIIRLIYAEIREHGVIAIHHLTSKGTPASIAQCKEHDDKPWHDILQYLGKPDKPGQVKINSKLKITQDWFMHQYAYMPYGLRNPGTIEPAHVSQLYRNKMFENDYITWIIFCTSQGSAYAVPAALMQTTPDEQDRQDAGGEPPRIMHAEWKELLFEYVRRIPLRGCFAVEHLEEHKKQIRDSFGMQLPPIYYGIDKVAKGIGLDRTTKPKKDRATQIIINAKVPLGAITKRLLNTDIDHVNQNTTQLMSPDQWAQTRQFRAYTQNTNGYKQTPPPIVPLDPIKPLTVKLSTRKCEQPEHPQFQSKMAAAAITAKAIIDCFAVGAMTLPIMRKMDNETRFMRAAIQLLLYKIDLDHHNSPIMEPSNKRYLPRQLSILLHATMKYYKCIILRGQKTEGQTYQEETQREKIRQDKTKEEQQAEYDEIEQLVVQPFTNIFAIAQEHVKIVIQYIAQQKDIGITRQTMLSMIAQASRNMHAHLMVELQAANKRLITEYIIKLPIVSQIVADTMTQISYWMKTQLITMELGHPMSARLQYYSSKHQDEFSELSFIPQVAGQAANAVRGPASALTLPMTAVMTGLFFGMPQATLQLPTTINVFNTHKQKFLTCMRDVPAVMIAHAKHVHNSRDDANFILQAPRIRRILQLYQRDDGNWPPFSTTTAYMHISIQTFAEQFNGKHDEHIERARTSLTTHKHTAKQQWLNLGTHRTEYKQAQKQYKEIVNTKQTQQQAWINMETLIAAIHNDFGQETDFGQMPEYTMELPWHEDPYWMAAFDFKHTQHRTYHGIEDDTLQHHDDRWPINIMITKDMDRNMNKHPEYLPDPHRMWPSPLFTARRRKRVLDQETTTRKYRSHLQRPGSSISAIKDCQNSIRYAWNAANLSSVFNETARIPPDRIITEKHDNDIHHYTQGCPILQWEENIKNPTCDTTKHHHPTIHSRQEMEFPQSIQIRQINHRDHTPPNNRESNKNTSPNINEAPACEIILPQPKTNKPEPSNRQVRPITPRQPEQTQTKLTPEQTKHFNIRADLSYSPKVDRWPTNATYGKCTTYYIKKTTDQDHPYKETDDPQDATANDYLLTDILSWPTCPKTEDNLKWRDKLSKEQKTVADAAGLCQRCFRCKNEGPNKTAVCPIKCSDSTEQQQLQNRRPDYNDNSPPARGPNQNRHHNDSYNHRPYRRQQSRESPRTSTPQYQSNNNGNRSRRDQSGFRHNNRDQSTQRNNKNTPNNQGNANRSRNNSAQPKRKYVDYNDTPEQQQPDGTTTRDNQQSISSKSSDNQNNNSTEYTPRSTEATKKRKQALDQQYNDEDSMYVDTSTVKQPPWIESNKTKQNRINEQANDKTKQQNKTQHASRSRSRHVRTQDDNNTDRNQPTNETQKERSHKQRAQRSKSTSTEPSGSRKPSKNTAEKPAQAPDDLMATPRLDYEGDTEPEDDKI